MNLLSWRIIDLIENIYLYRENKTLNIQLKTENSTIIRGDFSTHIYSFESDVSFGTTYESSVQF